VSQPVWTVWLADRFGNPLREITNNVVSLSGEPIRVIDNVSDISLGLVTDNYDLVCETQPWAREVQIYESGKIAWAGPITSSDFNWATGAIDLRAFDLLQWLSVRILRERIESGPVSAQFARIIELAMEGDDVGLIPAAQFVGTNADLRITDLIDAKNEIIDLAPFLDFTMHGRTLLVGAEEVPFAELQGDLVLPDHAKDFTLNRDGEEEASQFWVRGGDDLARIEGGDTEGIDGRRAVGSYPQEVIPHPEIGIVQRRVYDTSILSDETATKVAFSAFQYAQPPFFAIQATLAMDRCPFTFNQLVAGSTVTVGVPGLSCFPAQQIMRIQTVGLSIETTEDGFQENVTVDLIPAGVFTDDLSSIVL
jgi:hypothetical protein